MTKEELLGKLGRFTRKVMGNTEPVLVHDGDCEIYGLNVNICTCGLLHELIRCPDLSSEVYPKFGSEIGMQDRSFACLRKYQDSERGIERHADGSVSYKYWDGSVEKISKEAQDRLEFLDREAAKLLEMVFPNQYSFGEASKRAEEIIAQDKKE